MSTQSTYKAFRVEENEGKFSTAIKDIPFLNCSKGELLIKVSYSSLNYKDALSATGNKGVTRIFLTRQVLTPWVKLYLLSLLTST